MPGTAFKRTARAWHAMTMELVERPYAFVKQQMVRLFQISTIRSDK